jgi:hypothetical protein
MIELVLDESAGRATLEEPQWLAAWQAAGSPPFPEWAKPRTEGEPLASGTVSESGGLAGALKIRSDAVLLIEVATALDNFGLVAEVSTDLAAVVTVVRRVSIDQKAGAEATKMLLGVEVSGTVVDHLLSEILRLLPPTSGPNSLGEAELPAELTVAFGQAISQGNKEVIDAICADQGWANPPDVMLALVNELVGNAMITIQYHGGPMTLGQWLLTRRGWVELIPTSEGTVRHVPRTEDDIARTLISALSNSLTALYAQVAAAKSAQGDVDSDGDGDGDE